MEKKGSCLRARPMSILWGVLAILLCGAPALHAAVVPAGDTQDFSALVPGSLTVHGTANILPGAHIEYYITAGPTGTINVKGGTVGGVFGYDIDIAAGATVTIYGTGFNLPEGTYLNYDGIVTGNYENGDPIDLVIDCQPGAAVTLAAPGGPPPENSPPVAAAGPDIVVSTKDIASTIIEGTATDPDTEDSLTYRWLEGTVEFTLSALVGANGEAPLDLATILPQYLGIGTHILTLEVSDGQEIVSDEMILTIEVEQIEIDIKPDSENNVINLGSNGVVPVAILSSADFDATLLDPDSIFLAGAGVAVRGKGNKYLASQEDVNGDGLVDLVVKIETENLVPGEFQNGTAILQVMDGDTEIYMGSDEITIVPPE